MKKPVAIVITLTLCLLSLTEASAQWYAGHRVGYGYGGGYGYGSGGATTPAASAGHAMADMTRSQGMYNAMTSASMINVEQARSKYIEN